MAERPVPVLEFLADGCPDCGRRRIVPLRDPVPVPDDFDWTARDFEGFRRVMLEDLAAADPERLRWTEADQELAIVEVLAAGLDRASHGLDALFAERFVALARIPASLVRLLTMIDGIDPAHAAVRAELTPPERQAHGFDGGDRIRPLVAALTARPQLMDVARAAGLAGLGEIRSFITLEDLADFLATCPIIARAETRHRMAGGFGIYEAVTLLTETGLRLHDRVDEIGPHRAAFTEWIMAVRSRAIPPGQSVHPLLLLTPAALAGFTLRTAIARVTAPLLPLGTELRLLDGRRVGVFIRLCVEVAASFYRSEVEAEVRAVLSAAPGRLFDPVHFGFGDVLYLSDIEEALMAVPGVTGVIVNRLQIAGRPGTEATATGVLRPGRDEALTLDPVSPSSETGYVLLSLQGGQVG